MRRSKRNTSQIEFTEEPLAMTATAKNRLMSLIETERDARLRWQLQQAIADIDQAQRFWMVVSDYPYGRRRGA
jgi:hypothetical protein